MPAVCWRRRCRATPGDDDVLVLALPRGGVPVGFEVAAALQAPLDVFLVRKLGVPGHEELAMGAIATGGVRVLNDEVVRCARRMPDAAIEAVARPEQAELERRERLYRDDRPPPEVRGRTVILVDDGLATGSTMRAAVEALRRQQPRAHRRRRADRRGRRPARSCADEVDEVVCAEHAPPLPRRRPLVPRFLADERRGRARPARARAAGTGRRRAAPLRIPAGAALLDADLSLPAAASGLVLFAHGSGSSRFSPRNRHVARLLVGPRRGRRGVPVGHRPPRDLAYADPLCRNPYRRGRFRRRTRSARSNQMRQAACELA